MNTLSWLIYAAEVAGSIKGLATGGLVLLAIVGGFGVAFGPIAMDALDIDDPVAVAWSAAKKLVTAAVALACIVAFTPSPRTVYMIAASEAGEAIATTPDAIEMMSDLKAIIKKRLKEELAE